MDDKSQRERLEQELRFLKESFEAEVISKEEFEKGKERIERKLNEIAASEKTKHTANPLPEEQKNDAAIQSKSADKIKLNVIQDEEEHGHEHPQESLIQIKAKEDKEQKETTSYNEEFEKRKRGRFFKYGIVFLVLIIAIFFFYKSMNKGAAQQEPIELKLIECYSDKDCMQEGKEGICLEPGSANAKCEFTEIKKTSVLVLNDKKNCFNCDTKRVLGILEEWFGTVDAKEIDYNTLKGKEIAQEFDAELLPMYILGENLTQKPKFEQFKQSFVKKGDNYVLSDNAAGSTFYLKRGSIPNKLDFFVKENDISSISAEKNLQEFLDNFNEIEFDKHNSDDAVAKELLINTFPTFLVNNKVKFSGVRSADTIKENFCSLNDAPECEKELSGSLI